MRRLGIPGLFMLLSIAALVGCSADGTTTSGTLATFVTDFLRQIAAAFLT